MLALVMGMLLVSISHRRHAAGFSAPGLEEPFYIPDGKSMRIASLGHRTFVSSLLWVRGMFYFADAVFEKRKPTLLDPLLRGVVELDPDWRYPYEFGGLVLEDGAGTPSSEAVDLLRKGIRKFPGDWRLRLYLAMAIRSRGGSVSEVEAVLLPITKGAVPAPDYARTLVFSMVGTMSDSRREVRLISDLVRTTSDPMVGVTIQRKIENIIRKRVEDAPFEPSEAAQALFVLLKGEQAQVRLSQAILLDVMTESAQKGDAIRALANVVDDYRRFRNAQGVSPQ